ncbi:diguanylate cyclase (GGDEF) domain-containing protein [Loktanella fryxellensis]|uniref:Diguanylate cyclase (GGDEF) domain-containing protein n=1 Tax=Loktanella fryxellensis TaxID=245187 RepID=A0A1H8GPK7_9RHOB|nr:bifunctional diguanylate cyclase/phosphodiesterase [Loktanella fryxellensis]SEN45437.1 diguanylate cyclase (GGDEF) domain-containing protein [Loktanella fryxellensis]
MLDRLKNRFLFETRLTLHIVRRDRLRRLSLLPVLGGALLVAGDVQRMCIVALLAATSEVTMAVAGAGVPIDRPGIGLRRCIAVWVATIASTLAYLSAAWVMTDGHSSAMLIGACLWMFGVLVHISNSFVTVPIYNWSMLIPSGFCVAAIIHDVFDEPVTAPMPMEGWVLAGLLLVYFTNTVMTTQRQNDTQHAFETMRDLANRRLTELEDIASRDLLTGLPNRRVFDRIAQDSLQADRAGSGAVFLINLNGFRPINESYSQAAGDAVLIEVACRLRGLLMDSGIVARMDADTFAALIPGPSDTAGQLRIAADVQTAICQPITFEDRQLQVAASVAIAPVRANPSLAALMQQAEQAMDRAKATLDRPVVIYDPTRFPPRPTLDDRARIGAAMQADQIVPFYQPQVDIATGRVTGLEALARWVMPDGRVLSPGSFLPSIRDLGLQADFQHQILRHVLQDMQHLRDLGLLPDQISVNLSEVTLATTSGRGALIAAVARHPDLRPHLMFEVTEDIFIARAGRMIQESISLLRMTGVRIALDDFGTGFASFQHLQELECDELKLDSTFVRRLGQDPTAEVLIKAFLDMGRGLELAVVAEGVETRQQLDMLHALGCRTVQGYYYSPARPLGDVIGMLQSGIASAA